MRTMLIVCFLVALSTTLFAFDDRNTVTAGLQTVTVYRSGAEMIHTAKASLKSGSNELVIEGISNSIDINSLQVKCPAVVTILGIEYSNQYMLNETVTPVMKKLQDSLENTNEQIEKIAISIATIEDLLSVLKSNKEIKGSQTGLSVAELMQLMDYYKLKSAELQNDLSALRTKNAKYKETVQRLRQQIAEEQKKNTRSVGRVILQLSAALSGENEFTVSYITRNAYWTPYYDLKVDNIKNPIKLIYKAKVSQTTGLDWKKIKLSLSTSTPSQYGNAPLLKSWFLSYLNPVYRMEQNLSKMNMMPSALQEVVVVGYGASDKKVSIRGSNSISANSAPLYVVNGVVMSADDFVRIDPSSIKETNVLKDAAATSLYGARAANGVVLVTLRDGLEDYVSVSDNELDITYDIDLPYDIPTNGKEQIATLKETSISSIYKFYAVPKLDKDAYLLTEINDWEKLNLLPGEANIIFEGTYVGKTFIDPASTNDTLNLTLGKDKRVIIKREKLTDYSSVKFLGSNKLQTITYELTVKNNKKEPIFMILKDQYPISTNKEMEVELEESSNAEVNKEIGVLTWKLQLAPGESKKLRMSYSVKYPKGKLLQLN